MIFTTVEMERQMSGKVRAARSAALLACAAAALLAGAAHGSTAALQEPPSDSEAAPPVLEPGAASSPGASDQAEPEVSAQAPATTEGAVAGLDEAADFYGPPADEQVYIEFPDGVPNELAKGVAYALNDYPAIRAARLEEEAASDEVRAAEGQRYPTVTVDGQGLTGGSPVVANQNLALNLIVQQPLWSGGRIGAAIDRAEAARAVTQAATLETGENIAIQVVNAYYEALAALRRMAALDEGNTQLIDLVGSIERRVEQDVSPVADLTLVQSRQADIQRQYQVAQATYYSSRETYRQLTGLFQAELAEIPLYPGEAAHPQFTDAVEEAAQCNPLLKRLAAEAALAEANVKVARKELFPQVSAQFSQNEITGTRFGVVVRSQLNNGLSQFRLIDASQARQLQASTNIQTAARETRVRLTNDILLNYSTREQIPIVRKAVQAASDLTVSYRRQFVAGRRSWLDVVNAVREEISAELNLADAEVSAMASGARILIYTCRWTPSIGS
jgi:adhesin transport system outer membrane protein